MKIFSQLIAMAVLCLPLSQASAGGPSAELDRQLSAFHEGTVAPTLNSSESSSILSAEAAKGDTPLPKFVMALSRTRLDRNRAALPLLAQIRTQHEKLTKRALYPQSYRYVRGVDYQQKICDAIDEVIRSLNQGN